MRRTLFVVPAALTPVVHHAVSPDVAATMRKRLLEAGVLTAVGRLHVASGAQLGAAEPRLRTVVLPRTRKSYDVRRTITSQVLVLMAAEGHLVRRQPLGSWTSRQHTWAAAARGGPKASTVGAGARPRRTRYGVPESPRTGHTDLAWWTGWPLGVTRWALAALEVVELDGGLVLADDTDPVAAAPPGAVLLPALDPTPMGWKQREWFLPPDPRPLYDSHGNIGPTLWWDGEVVGGWAVRADGSVATRLLVDRGAEAASAVPAAAQALEPRLAGAVVVPSFRTPLERALSLPG